MKKRIIFIAALLCGMCFTTASAQFKIGGKKINVGKVVQAGSDAAKAITLSDADIAAMSKEYMQWMDTHNPLTAADSEYGKRLEKLSELLMNFFKKTEAGPHILGSGLG